MVAKRWNSGVARMVFFLALCACGAFSFTVASVRASEVPERPPETREDAPFRTEMRERREQYQQTATIASSTTSFRERIVERRAVFTASVKERMKNLLDNVTARIDALISRCEHIAQRIESRATKLEAEGRDVSGVREALIRVSTSLENARVLRGTLGETSIDRVVDDADPRSRFVELRTQIAEVHTEITSAHTALKDAVGALRTATEAVPVDTPTATTTAETSDTSS